MNLTLFKTKFEAETRDNNWKKVLRGQNVCQKKREKSFILVILSTEKNVDDSNGYIQQNRIYQGIKLKN